MSEKVMKSWLVRGLQATSVIYAESRPDAEASFRSLFPHEKNSLLSSRRICLEICSGPHASDPIPQD